MALGKRKKEQQDLWIAVGDLPTSEGHPFYQKLNKLLAEARFDDYVEQLCSSYYAKSLGRPGIPPGVYFRMLFVGYFEGLGSQRGIAWRCGDSRSLQGFLGVPITETTPDHSSLTVIRKRLPMEIHEQVFAFVLRIAQDKKLLGGKSLAVDSTMLEANAAMKSIVRKDTGEDWKEYLRKLAAEQGLEDLSDEELRRFDQQRKDKNVSNDEWHNPNDPDAKIAKMKDGTTHLAYKAEHAVDLKSDLIVAANVCLADRADTRTLPETLIIAQANMIRADSEIEIREVACDKGYHGAEPMVWCESVRVRTYIPERESRHARRWTDKPEAYKRTVYNNRRRVRGNYGKSMGQLRSEYVERSFAHVCETGGARRSWLRGLIDVMKRYLIHTAGRNLGVIMRALCGMGTPRSLQAEGQASACAFLRSIGRVEACARRVMTRCDALCVIVAKHCMDGLAAAHPLARLAA